MSRAGDEHVGGVEGAQLGRLVRPAERGERPQRRREPGVEHVGVALPALALRRLLADVGLVRRGTRPGSGGPTRAGARCTRAGCSRASRGRPSCAAPRGGSACGRRARPRSPAWRARSCRRTTGARSAARSAGPSGASAARRARRAGCRRRGPRSRSAATTASRASSTRQAAERLGRGVGDRPVLADHGDLVEPVLAADLEVVRVVARRDLERAGAELGVHVLVGDDRQPAAHQRQDRRLADQPRVALVAGFTATAVSASIVSGRTVATVTEPEPDSSG